MTTPMEMFQAMQAKLRESSREYETIAEGARTTSDERRATMETETREDAGWARMTRVD